MVKGVLKRLWVVRNTGFAWQGRSGCIVRGRKGCVSGRLLIQSTLDMCGMKQMEVLFARMIETELKQCLLGIATSHSAFFLYS